MAYESTALTSELPRQGYAGNLDVVATNRSIYCVRIHCPPGAIPGLWGLVAGRSRTHLSITYHGRWCLASQEQQSDTERLVASWLTRLPV